MSHDFLDMKQCAEEAGVTTQTVRKWIREGKLKGHRFGERRLRVSQEAWDEFVRASEVKVSPRLRELAND